MWTASSRGSANLGSDHGVAACGHPTGARRRARSIARPDAWIACSALLLGAFACGPAAPPPAPRGQATAATSAKPPRTAARTGAPTPADCDSPLEAARKLLVAESPGSETTGAEVTEPLDFDGDGRKDAAVTFRESCGSGGCDYWLFLWDGGCARFVGKLFGQELLPRGRGPDGSLVLGTEAYAGSVEWLEQEARRDGRGMYSVFRERTCVATSDRPGQKCSAWTEPGRSTKP